MNTALLLILTACAVGGGSAFLVALARPKFALIGGALLVLMGITAMRPRLALYMLCAALMVSSGYLKLAGVGVFTALLLWSLSMRRPLVRFDPLFLLVGLVATSAVLATVTAPTHINLIGDTLTYIGYFALYWAVVSAVDNRQALRYLIGWISAGAVVTALIGIVQYKMHFLLLRSQYAEFLARSKDLSANLSHASLANAVPLTVFQGWAGRFRIESLDGVPDYVAMHMAVVAPFIFYWMIRQRSLTRRIVGAAALAIMLTAVVMTFSRTGMLAFAAMTVVIAFKFGLRRAMPVILPMVLVAGIVAVGYAPLRTRITSIVTEQSSTQNQIVDTRTDQTLLNSSQWRIESNKVGLEMFRDHFFQPVGAGQMNWLWHSYRPDLVPLGVEWVLPLHFAYLLTGIELGLLGLVALLLIIYVSFRWTRRISRVFKERGDEELWSITQATQVALIAVALAGFFYPVFDNFRYFWLLIALVGVLHHLAAQPAAEPAPSRTHSE
ncbi:MAG: O-antigen ligase family protein [Dehalococcoidia bacterium]